jgi:hypothetical protein
MIRFVLLALSMGTDTGRRVVGLVLPVVPVVGLTRPGDILEQPSMDERFDPALASSSEQRSVNAIALVSGNTPL